MPEAYGTRNGLQAWEGEAMPRAAPGDPSPAAGRLAPCKPTSLGSGDNSPPEQRLHSSEMHNGKPGQKKPVG